jgi:hypothetical protein
MFYTFIQTGEQIVEGQPQKHFKVSIFEDEAKTIFIGENSYIAGEAAYDDPEAEFLKSVNATPKPHVWNYQDDRKNAYPSIAEQLDTLYHGGYDAWKETIKSIKDKYPKE